MEPKAQWVVDEQQESFLSTVFDLTIAGVVELDPRIDIDWPASQAIGQNRQEMTIDRDTVEIIAMYLAEGVKMPMPLVWRKDGRQRKFVLLDGNHRVRSAVDVLGDPNIQALEIRCDTRVAQWIAVAVNLMHGRTVREPEYLATTMRLLHEQGLPMAQIARIYGMSDSQVRVLTKRDEQADRLRVLLPHRRGGVKAHSLDALGQLEDAHVQIMGDAFLDASKTQQVDILARLKSTPSANRDDVAHEIVGELRAAERERSKVRARETRPAGQLQGALQRLVGVVDLQRAYSGCSDRAKATVRANLSDVLPRLAKLWNAIGDPVVG